MQASKPYRLFLHGPFALVDPDGAPIDVPSRKGRALIAAVALAPPRGRTRAWLQSHLWSRCDRAAAQVSLRKELSNLRRALGPAADAVLEIGRDAVALRPGTCEVVTDGPGTGVPLEGLDLPGEGGFADWLAAQRRPSAPRGPAVLRGAEPPSSPLRVALVTAGDGAALPPGSGIADVLASRIGRGLAESGCVSVLDRRRPGPPPAPGVEPDYSVSCAEVRIGGGRLLTVDVVRMRDGELVATPQVAIDGPDAETAETTALSVLVVEAVDQILAAALRDPDSGLGPQRTAGALVLRAVDKMFGLGHGDQIEAGALLAEAAGLRRHGTILAWRAYQTVFRLDGPSAPDAKALREEASELIAEVEALDRYNGLSLSLVAHVCSFLLRDFGRAGEYLERARALGCDHVMWHDTMALLAFYRGDIDRARDAARAAEARGRHLSFRYCFATSQCMIEALGGDYAAAIRHGERAIDLQPAGARRPYPPTLRYLGASYAAIGRVSAAERTFATLKGMEPMLSSRAVGTIDYPVPSPTAAEFLRRGLRTVAM